MVGADLMDSGLHNQYWSDAIIHSVFVKNRLPHQAFKHNSTPYEQMTGTKPNMKHLKVFGSPITTMKSGRRPVKLDTHCYHGRFLRYAKSMKNVVYIDTKTKKIKTTASAIFDEAHFSQQSKSRGAQRIYTIGKPHEDVAMDTPPHIKVNTTRGNEYHHHDTDTLTLTIKHKDAILPTRGSEQSAGLDLHSMHKTIVPPHNRILIDTGIAM